MSENRGPGKLKKRGVKHQNTLNPRRQPVQQRARERTRQILDTTARLLQEVGIDALTTILIARELGISVGSLYHYFPNKHAILFALAEQWLAEVAVAMDDITQLELDQLPIDAFVEAAIDRLLVVYRSQQAMLPLAQALWSIPQLRDLDARHDQLVIGKLAGIFKRLDFPGGPGELERVGRVFLETTHALLLTAVSQDSAQSRRSLEDLKSMMVCLLEQHARHPGA